MNYSNAIKTLRIRPDGSGYTVAAGTTDVNSDIIDTQGYEAVRFILGLGAITSGAVTSCKAQQNTANSGTGMADLAGTAVTIADDDDNQIVILEVKPLERYVRLAIDRGTQNAVVDFLIAELFGPKVVPVTQDSTIVIAQEIHVQPEEGTA